MGSRSRSYEQKKFTEIPQRICFLLANERSIADTFVCFCLYSNKLYCFIGQGHVKDKLKDLFYVYFILPHRLRSFNDRNNAISS